MKIKLTLVFIFLTIVSFSQSKYVFLFEEGAEICFVGNSITHGGGFHHNIMLYQMTRFPQQKVTFYNCGIGGNQAHDVLNRMESDILIHNPSHAIIMLGMNDVHRDLYENYSTLNEDTLKRRKEVIAAYKNSMKKVIETFLSKDIKVFLQTPSIYEQTATIPAKNFFGVNNALKECKDFIEQLASKHNLPVIDYWTIMAEIDKEIQKENPESTIIGKDRVHPGSTGQFIMSYQFLKSMKAPGYVSKIVVNSRKPGDSEQCVNCSVEPVENDSPDCLNFTIKENALPFPIDETQREGAELVPFMEEFNNQYLRVVGLKRGQYQLKIDDVMMGVFSSRQLKKGINLAEFENTPQYRQAENVLEKLQEIWKYEGILRDLGFVEYSSTYINYQGNKDNLNEYRDFYLKKASKSAYKTYLEYVINRYVDNKPKEKFYEKEILRLREEAYEEVQPESHNFELIKM